MRDIVNWLITLERKAYGIYSAAALVFHREPAFAAFLEDLALDETYHVQFMLVAAEYADDLTRCQRGVVLDSHTRGLIETPFREAQERVAAGSLTRDEMAALTSGLLATDGPTTCPTSFTAWLAAHASELGTRYASDVRRHW